MGGRVADDETLHFIGEVVTRQIYFELHLRLCRTVTQSERRFLSWGFFISGWRFLAWHELLGSIGCASVRRKWFGAVSLGRSPFDTSLKVRVLMSASARNPRLGAPSHP